MKRQGALVERGVAKRPRQNPQDWDSRDVATFVEQVAADEFAAKLVDHVREQDINGPQLLAWDDNDLKSFGLHNRKARKDMLKAIKQAVEAPSASPDFGAKTSERKTPTTRVDRTIASGMGNIGSITNSTTASGMGNIGSITNSTINNEVHNVVTKVYHTLQEKLYILKAPNASQYESLVENLFLKYTVGSPSSEISPQLIERITGFNTTLQYVPMLQGEVQCEIIYERRQRGNYGQPNPGQPALWLSARRSVVCTFATTLTTHCIKSLKDAPSGVLEDMFDWKDLRVGQLDCLPAHVEVLDANVLPRDAQYKLDEFLKIKAKQNFSLDERRHAVSTKNWDKELIYVPVVAVRVDISDFGTHRFVMSPHTTKTVPASIIPDLPGGGYSRDWLCSLLTFLFITTAIVSWYNQRYHLSQPDTTAIVSWFNQRYQFSQPEPKPWFNQLLFGERQWVLVVALGFWLFVELINRRSFMQASFEKRQAAYKRFSETSTCWSLCDDNREAQ